MTNKDTLKDEYTVLNLKRLATPQAEILTDGERLTSFIKLAQQLPDLKEIIEQTRKEMSDKIIEQAEKETDYKTKSGLYLAYDIINNK